MKTEEQIRTTILIKNQLLEGYKSQIEDLKSKIETYEKDIKELEKLL